MEASHNQPQEQLQFIDLPHALAYLCFSHLSPRTLALCACVSRGFRELAAQRHWRQLYANLWPLPPLDSDPAASSNGHAISCSMTGCGIVNSHISPWAFTSSGTTDSGAKWRQRYDVSRGASQFPADSTHNVAASWQRRYGQRQLDSRCWLGRPGMDKLMGAADAVKACCLLPEQGLLITGGMDRVVRVWDLHSGTQLAASRRHGGTVRCLAADATLLASGSSDHSIRVWRRCGTASSTAVVGGNGSGTSYGTSSRGGGGSGSGSGRSGSGSNGSGSGSGGCGCTAGCSPVLFDVAGERAILTGHAGPVSSLQLGPGVLVSGSWDCSIRLWDRATLECRQLVHTDDWVSCLSLRGGLLGAACGRELLLFRLDGGALRRCATLTFPALSDSRIVSSDTSAAAAAAAAAAPASLTAVECTCDGRAVFVGTADGGVWTAEVPPTTPFHSSPAGNSSDGDGSGGSGGRGTARMYGGEQSAGRYQLLVQRAAEVSGLSWEHPWLAVADRSGMVVLLGCGTATLAGEAAVEGDGLGNNSGSTRTAGKGGGKGSTNGRKQQQQHQRQQQRQLRVLHTSGMGGSCGTAGVLCVALSSFWAAAGLDCGTILTWDGGRALQQQQAAAAARQHKAERRQRNVERQQRQQQRQQQPQEKQLQRLRQWYGRMQEEQQRQLQQEEQQRQECS